MAIVQADAHAEREPARPLPDRARRVRFAEPRDGGEGLRDADRAAVTGIYSLEAFAPAARDQAR